MFAIRPLAKPSPLPASAELNEWSLVLIPVQNSRAVAERLRHFVDRRGHRAVVEAAGSPERRRYRVRVLGLKNREEAVRAEARLRSENLRPTVVPPS